jgi:phosphoribosylformylglycinamidine synthase
VASEQKENFNDDLLKILSSLNVCSKEWVIRQYDHEVQGGSVIKPLVGSENDGPSDAAVIAPVLGSTRGLAIGCGINPRYGDLDPYWMAASAIDEAVRNVVAVGADPARIALLDNFCWGNTNQPETLGSLVRAAEACRDVALAYGMPFISGKDSLNNEFHAGNVHIVIPPTLLISAIGFVPDVRKCVTMDLKKPGNVLFRVGATGGELGGSHFHMVNGLRGGVVPQVDFARARKVFRAVHEAIGRGLIASCHDVGEGGIAVALAEMCLAGGFGAWVDLTLDTYPPEVRLFCESNTRFLLEVEEHHAVQFCQIFQGLSFERIGLVSSTKELLLTVEDEEMIRRSIEELKEAWQRPLRW